MFSCGKILRKRAKTESPPTPESKNPIEFIFCVLSLLYICFIPKPKISTLNQGESYFFFKYSIIPSAIAFAVACLRLSVINSARSSAFDKNPVSTSTAGTSV